MFVCMVNKGLFLSYRCFVHCKPLFLSLLLPLFHVPCVTVFFHSSGCISGIAPHLIELIPFLVNSLSDKRVRNLMRMSH